VANLEITPTFAGQGSGNVSIDAAFTCSPGDGALSTSTVTVFDPSGKRVSTATMPISGQPGASGKMAFQMDTSSAGTFTVQVFVTDDSGAISNTAARVFAVLNPRTQGPPWRTGAPMPTPRGGLGAGTIGGKLYVVGGRDAQGNDVNVTECYDPSIDSWTARSPMPFGGEVVAVVLDGKLYALGACATRNDCALVQQYDAQTDTWTIKAPIPHGYLSGYYTAGVVNGKIYCTGESRDSIYYTPERDEWTTMPAPVLGIWGAAGVVLGDRLYLAGGTVGDDIYSSFGSWDPIANTYVPETGMSLSLCFATAAAPDGKIYVIGGDGYDTAAPYLSYRSHAEVEQYDPSTSGWTAKTSMPTARQSLASAVIDGKIYVVGGYTISIGEAPTDKLEIYDPAAD
jgi:N-acetylneuraminic acid mutarotase